MGRLKVQHEFKKWAHGNRKCSVDGCAKKSTRFFIGKKYCPMHFWRVRNHGNTGGSEPLIIRHKGTLLQRMFLKRKIAINGCWEFQGCRNKKGYGYIGDNKLIKVVHRASWELFIGNIPDGLLVCHKCDNPPCFNPDHLFIGTNKDNFEDAFNKGRVDPSKKGYVGGKRRWDKEYREKK